MTRVRILILTSSTGAGHDARAQAFAEWCFELYRHNVDVRIEQMLEKSSGFFSAGVRFYNWIQQKSPWIHKAFYLFVELLSLLNRRSVSFASAARASRTPPGSRPGVRRTSSRSSADAGITLFCAT